MGIDSGINTKIGHSEILYVEVELHCEAFTFKIHLTNSNIISICISKYLAGPSLFNFNFFIFLYCAIINYNGYLYVYYVLVQFILLYIYYVVSNFIINCLCVSLVILYYCLYFNTNPTVFKCYNTLHSID